MGRRRHEYSKIPSEKAGMYPVKEIIGLTFEQARDRLAVEGYTIRVTCRDGNFLTIFNNYDPARINVSTIDGVVDEVTGCG